MIWEIYSSQYNPQRATEQLNWKSFVSSLIQPTHLIDEEVEILRRKEICPLVQARTFYTKVNLHQNNLIIRVLFWCSRLRVKHCNCSSLGHCCGTGSIRGLGNLIWWELSQKKNWIIKKRKICSLTRGVHNDTFARSKNRKEQQNNSLNTSIN